MLWQTEAGMWFKMPGGYFVGPGPSGGALHEAPPSTTSLALDRIQQGGRPPDLTPALRGQMARDFARWRVRSVVLGPMPHRRVMAGFLTDLLGRAPQRLAGVELWGDAMVAPTTRREVTATSPRAGWAADLAQNGRSRQSSVG